MRGRRSKAAAVLEHEIAELAEHALDAAREAGHAAAPAIQHSAEGLARAFEKTSAGLLEAAERFGQSGERSGPAVTTAARERLADASERFAESIRPKRQHHRLRNLLFAAMAIGGIVALVQSPLRGKLTARFFGPPPEDENLGSITLPSDDSTSASQIGRKRSYDDAPTPAGVTGNDGAGSTPSVRADSARD